MSSLASHLERMSRRVDKLQLQVNAMRDNAEANEGRQHADTATSQQTSDIKALREDLNALRDAQPASAKKERSVIEAVLTQKLERTLGDKAASAAQTATQEIMQNDGVVKRLTDRVSAISTEVENQAKFLQELGGKIERLVNDTVQRAVSNRDAGAQNVAQGEEQSTEKHLSGTPGCEALEDAPALDAAEQSGEADQSESKSSDTVQQPDAAECQDASEIEMTPARKKRASGRRKPASNSS